MEGYNVYVGRKRFAEAVPIDEVYCNYSSGMFLHCLLKKQANNPTPSPQFSWICFSLWHSTLFICYMGEKTTQSIIYMYCFVPTYRYFSKNICIYIYILKCA